jgi:class 3 adenylate cyclase
MEREQLLAALAAQEQLRGVIPDEVIDATITMLRSQLQGAPVPAQRRRQVTVLFADVSGFTAMSESMDAEVVAELMNELWEQLDEVVIDHGGRVDKHIGDALMAVWGAEATAEDDAEHAVRAALGLRTELDQFGVASGWDLGMRVGVNTGPVFGWAGRLDSGVHGHGRRGQYSEPSRTCGPP